MSRKPNIIWIVSDHQIHASRPPGFEQFPLQNKLRQLGTEFTHAYTALPVCSPVRASMLNGLYPHAHGLTENDGRFGGRQGLDCTDWMVHRPLREAGYRCGWFGKWHVDNRDSALNYGFEGFSLPGYGYPYATEAYRQYLKRRGINEPVARMEIPGESGLAQGAEISLTEASSWFDYESGVARLDGPADVHEAFFLTDLSQRWIDGIEDEPFFLRIDTWGPHPPYLLAKPYLGVLDDQVIELPQNFDFDLNNRPQHHRDYRDYWRDTLNLDRAQWHSMYVRALEHVILVESALCKLLERVDLENTLVIFNSDHGDAVGSNGAVANKGGLMAEATMQIPLLIAGAGFPAGKNCDQLVSNLDLTPTLLDICDINVNRPFHGKSLLPLLENSQANWRNGFMAQHNGLHELLPQRAWYQHEWKLVVQQDGYRELYDLSNDPQELMNLALQEAYRDRLLQMERALLSAIRAVDDGFSFSAPGRIE